MADRPRQTQVIVNNIDVSDYVVSWETNIEYDTYIGEADIVLSKAVVAILNIDLDNAPGYQVIIRRGIDTPDEEIVFRGEVIFLNIGLTTFALKCNDRYYEAVRHNVTTSYDINIDAQQGVGSEIYKNLINEYTTLYVDDLTVVSTIDLPKIIKYICKNADVYERCDRLAEVFNYQHYYNPVLDRPVFEPKGILDTEEVLTVGENIVEVPLWKTDKTKLINKVIVKGAEQLVGDTQFFNGSNTEGQFFTLTYVPVALKVYVGDGVFDPTGAGTKPSDNEGNLMKGGKVGATSGVYDYEYDDDVRIKRLYFYDSTRGDQPSFTPSVGTNNIEAQVTYALPIQIQGENDTSISEYGVHEKEIYLPDIKSFDDAYSYMLSYLDYYSLPFISSTLKVINSTPIQVGRTYQIFDSVNNINKLLAVTKIKKQYPYVSDEVTVGDEALREIEFNLNVLDRIKRLEELTTEGEDLVIQVMLINNKINLESRYLKQELKALDYGFILGHPTVGILGTARLGEEYFPLEIINMVPGKNTFKELLYDDEFFDADESDAEVIWYVD